MSKNGRRLYEQFKPGHYNLELTVNQENKTFNGKVIIRGQKIGRPSQRITLHQKDLKILSAKITKHDKKGDQPVEISRINLQKSFDEVRLHSPNMIYPGSYTVEVGFTGQLSPEISAQIKKLEGKANRQIFPCIDEPEAQATLMIEPAPIKS